jgi:hypothetical protein
MSNIADLLKDISGSDNKAVGLLGSFIGTLADLSGGIQAISTLVNLFASNDNAEILAKLSDIQTAIQRDFAALQAETRAANILSRLANLDPAIAQAQAVMDQLPDDLSQTPPVSEEYRLQQIGLCLNAVELLDQDDKWSTNFADEVYYGFNWVDPTTGQSTPTDEWTRLVAPNPNPDGTVFSTRYVLPYYLRVLYDFMLVAAAFEANYSTSYKSPLQRFTARLQTAHDISRQGIVTIRTPTRSEAGVGPPGSATYDVSGPYLDGPIGQSQWHSPFVSSLEFGPIHMSTPPTPEVRQTLDAQYLRGMDDAYFQEYGAVHTYSADSNISHYPVVLLPTVAPDVYWGQFSAKLSLANRRNWKEVYADVGLATVWTTINALRDLTGDPPLGTFDPDAVWTLREINQILGTAFGNPPVLVPPAISAADVISRLAMAGGAPSNRPLSLRSALSAALSAATVTSVQIDVP